MMLDVFSQVHAPLLKFFFESFQAPSALCILGPVGCGKKAVAFLIAKFILCSQKKSYGACENCESCLQFASQNHIAFYSLMEQSLSIDQTRSLLYDLQYKSFTGGFRVIYIEACEKATLPAQHALLKMIEEPPPSVTFILTTTHAEKILPTLLSRCQKIRLTLRDSKAIFNLFQNAPQVEIITLHAYAALYPAQLLINPSHFSKSRELMLFFQNFQEYLSLIEYFSQTEEHFLLLLDLWEQLIHFGCCLRIGYSHPWENHSEFTGLKMHFTEQKIPFEFLYQSLIKVQQIRQHTNTPMNKKIALTYLLTDWIARTA